MIRAIYHVVPLGLADRQPTLIFNLGDGFAWVKSPESPAWQGHFATAIGAEAAARQAGLDPQAIAYISKNRA